MTVIITPERAFAGLVESFDAALSNLDDAGVHFGNSILNIESTLESITNEDDKKAFLAMVENYILMSGFLIDHPLIAVMKKIRDSTVIEESEPPVMAVNNIIFKGQQWRHYKGTVYTIVSVARNANNPAIVEIHYEDDTGENAWSLPIHEFCKMVKHDDIEVYRFTYIKA